MPATPRRSHSTRLPPHDESSTNSTSGTSSLETGRDLVSGQTEIGGAGNVFLLGQFLSPLFNHRTDRHGGSIDARAQLLVDIMRAVRAAVGVEFAIAVKINSSDQLVGGLDEDDALSAISLLWRQERPTPSVSPGRWCSTRPAQSLTATDGGDPPFPTLDAPPPGGITAWLTMCLTAISDGTDGAAPT